MLTLAAQCGLHRYLDARLCQDGVVPHPAHMRSLLDYALVSHPESERFVCVRTVAALLKHGADPNRLEISLAKSPWRNALLFLNNMGVGSRVKIHGR